MSCSADDSHGANIRCFGVGDGWPAADRKPSSFLFRFRETTLLVDCGDGLSSAYKATGLSYDAVDQILISHFHSDHVGGLSMFLQGLWLERRQKPLTIHAPAAGLAALQAWLEATLLPPELLGFPLHWRPLVAGEALKFEGLNVTAYPTAHLDSLRHRLQPRYPAMCFDAFSFVFEAAGKRIAHTADIGTVEDLKPLLRQPVEVLVCELAHVAAGPLLKTLADSPIGKVIFIHLGREFWSDLPATEALIRRELGAMPFVIARDGEQFAL
jgi:ribonuclease Z